MILEQMTEQRPGLRSATEYDVPFLDFDSAQADQVRQVLRQVSEVTTGYYKEEAEATLAWLDGGPEVVSRGRPLLTHADGVLCFIQGAIRGGKRCLFTREKYLENAFRHVRFIEPPKESLPLFATQRPALVPVPVRVTSEEARREWRLAVKAYDPKKPAKEAAARLEAARVELYRTGGHLP